MRVRRKERPAGSGRERAWFLAVNQCSEPPYSLNPGCAHPQPPTEMGRWRGQDLNDLSIWISTPWTLHRDSQVAPWLRTGLPMQEKWVQSLGQENPLEEGMAIHSSILAGKITWTEESEGLQSVGSQKVWHSWARTHELCMSLAQSIGNPRQRKRVINNLIPCQFVCDKGSYLLWRDN